jgi:hypothetical protein
MDGPVTRLQPMSHTAQDDFAVAMHSSYGHGKLEPLQPQLPTVESSCKPRTQPSGDAGSDGTSSLDDFCLGMPPATLGPAQETCPLLSAQRLGGACVKVCTTAAAGTTGGPARRLRPQQTKEARARAPAVARMRSSRAARPHVAGRTALSATPPPGHQGEAWSRICTRSAAWRARAPAPPGTSCASLAGGPGRSAPAPTAPAPPPPARVPHASCASRSLALHVSATTRSVNPSACQSSHASTGDRPTMSVCMQPPRVQPPRCAPPRCSPPRCAPPRCAPPALYAPGPRKGCWVHKLPVWRP